MRGALIFHLTSPHRGTCERREPVNQMPSFYDFPFPSYNLARDRRTDTMQCLT